MHFGQSFDDSGMLGGQSEGLAKIGVEVVQFPVHGLLGSASPCSITSDSSITSDMVVGKLQDD